MLGNIENNDLINYLLLKINELEYDILKNFKQFDYQNLGVITKNEVSFLKK